MRRLSRPAAALLAALTTVAFLQGPSAAARAQPATSAGASPRAPAEDGSTVVAELEVVGRPPGPALWRVRRGGSEVVILGAVSPLPQSLRWDEAAVGRALDGARQLLTPPEAQLSLFDGPGAAIQFIRLRALTPLNRRTPPPLYARVTAAARLAHADPAKLNGWRPAAAGGWLLADFYKAAGLSLAKPTSTVVRLAQARRIPVRPILRVGGGPFLSAFANMDEAAQQRCLEAAVDEVDWQAGHARPAAEAWAAGRVDRVGAERSHALWTSCLEQMPSVRALQDRGVSQAFTAMDAALREPGRTVAVVDLRYLDVRNGLLDRLRATGATVDVPPA